MKYYSDKCSAKISHGFTSEFADDFFEIENAYIQTELMGGQISKKIIDSKTDIHNKGVKI